MFRHGRKFGSTVPAFDHPIATEAVFEKLIDKETLAELLGISVSYINKLIATGQLPHFKIGKSVRFKVSEVATFLEKRRVS